jgi:hypothetical protein
MEFSEYFEDFMEELRSNAIENGSSKAIEFLTSSMDRIVDYGDLEDYDILEYNEDFNNTKPIHAYHFNAIFRQLTVVVNLFQDISLENLDNLTNSDLKAPYSRAHKFIVSSLKASPSDVDPEKKGAYFFIQQLKESWPTTKELKIIFITNKPLSKRYDHKDQGNIDDVNVSIGIWDLRRFHEVENSGTEREEIEIDFSHKPLPALVASKSEQIASYLVVMPAPELADIYEKYKSRVLEQNVRSFLQNRSNVNKGIRVTLKEAPERFFAYNNGITATAQSAEFDKNGAITKLKNLQIVNGGQTTAQIFNGKKLGDDLSNVSVQMKLNLIEDESLIDEIVPNIAKFANSQNPVSQADLFSNSPFHIRIEKFSRENIPPVMLGKAFSERWFYERSRGQYLNEQADLTAAGRKEFQRINPKPKMVTKTDLAIVLNSWDQKPYDVSKGAQANFKTFAKSIGDMEKVGDRYNKRYFEECIAKTIVFREFRKEIPRQEWYSGFPANIVTYSISWFAYCMQTSGVALNIDKIWKYQNSDLELIQMLLSIAEDVNSHLLSYAGNPTTYAKNIQCWKDILEKFEPLTHNEDGNIFISAEKAASIENEAEEEQGALDEITNEIVLFSIHPDCWNEIKNFIGNKMSPSKNADIEKLRRGQMISEFKVKPLAKFVREYQKAGGQIVFKNDLAPYSVS